jgi:small redox-active disulfide protein 2
MMRNYQIEMYFLMTANQGELTMKIEVLGTGCADCKKLYENTQKALEESGIQGELVKVEGISAMLKYGIISPPALVIDGKVKFSGLLLSAAEIKDIL